MKKKHYTILTGQNLWKKRIDLKKSTIMPYNNLNALPPHPPHHFSPRPHLVSDSTTWLFYVVPRGLPCSHRTRHHPRDVSEIPVDELSLHTHPHPRDHPLCRWALYLCWGATLWLDTRYARAGEEQLWQSRTPCAGIHPSISREGDSPTKKYYTKKLMGLISLYYPRNGSEFALWDIRVGSFCVDGLCRRLIPRDTGIYLGHAVQYVLCDDRSYSWNCTLQSVAWSGDEEYEVILFVNFASHSPSHSDGASLNSDTLNFLLTPISKWVRGKGITSSKLVEYSCSYSSSYVLNIWIVCCYMN